MSKGIAADMNAFQDRVAAWVRSTFGEASLTDPAERARRVLEEAAELAQAVGLDGRDARMILEDVYAREPGVAGQEVGGLANTLGALCAGLGISLAAEADREMTRVEHPDVVAKCRRKNADKAARGVSSGAYRNLIVFGDTLYELTQAYAEGVIAFRGGVTRFDSPPFPKGSEDADQWMTGFYNAEEWDHFLPDGTDALAIIPDGREIRAPELDADHSPA